MRSVPQGPLEAFLVAETLCISDRDRDPSIVTPCRPPLHEGLPQRGLHSNPGQRRGIAFEPHENGGRCLPEGLRAGDFQGGMRV